MRVALVSITAITMLGWMDRRFYAWREARLTREALDWVEGLVRRLVPPMVLRRALLEPTGLPCRRRRPAVERAAPTWLRLRRRLAVLVLVVLLVAVLVAVRRLRRRPTPIPLAVDEPVAVDLRDMALERALLAPSLLRRPARDRDRKLEPPAWLIDDERDRPRIVREGTDDRRAIRLVSRGLEADRWVVVGVGW